MLQVSHDCSPGTPEMEPDQRDSARKHLTLIAYKVNIQKSIVFLSSTIKLENKILKALCNSIRNIKYLGINLKIWEDLLTEN